MVLAADMPKPLTIESLWEFPEDGVRREVITGELIVTASPTPLHQRVSMRLSRLLSAFVDETGLGEIYAAPIDVRLSPNDIVVPDLLFVPAERRGISDGKFIDGAPSMVVEILSPSTQSRDQIRKRALYARSGVSEYWIVDPERESIVMLKLVDGQYEPLVDEHGQPQTEVLAGLLLDLPALFRRN
jgi:Uma2 family endonuclease